MGTGSMLVISWNDGNGDAYSNGACDDGDDVVDDDGDHDDDGDNWD